MTGGDIVSGVSDQRPLPTLILIHAAGPAGRTWRNNVGPLSAHFRVLTPDLPGFGTDTASGTAFTFAGAVEAIAELARDAGSRVHLCGLSLGAMVAALVAADHPDLVDRLVLSGIALTPAATEPRTIRRYRRAPGFAIRMFTDVPDRARWLAMIDEIEPCDLRPALARIAARTLVVCGRRDRKNLADSRIAADLIPDALYFEVPHVGHSWPVFAPKPFNAIVDGFLHT